MSLLTENPSAAAVDERPDSTGGVSRRAGVGAVVVGLAGIAVTTFWPPVTDLEIVALTVFVGVLLGGVAAVARRGWSPRDVRVGAAIGTVLVIGGQTLGGPSYLDFDVFVVSALAAASMAAVALVRVSIPLRWAVALAFVAVALVAAGSGWAVRAESPDIDVVALHEQAVDALVAGENPYTTGNVAVMETKPLGENELIEEYTYPPLNLAWYAVGHAISGEVRTGGAVALVLTILLFGLVAIRKARVGAGLVGTVAVAGLALLISNQAMYFMVANGWTEVTALPFVLLAILWWRRYPVASAIALGLALASKQYFVLAVPVLLVLPDAWRLRRFLIASATATATLVPFLVWDARGLIDGVIVHHLTRELRPDSATWANLGIEVPSVVAVAVAAAVGVWIARKALGPGLAIIAIAAAVAAFTLLAIRGFVNSWWLVHCLVVIGLVVPDTPRRALEPQT